MLLELSIHNLVLVEELTLTLPPGFIAVTGETGAGKSLFILALSLLRGERAGPDLIRSGREEALVEGLFKLHDPGVLIHLKEEGYLKDEEEPILIRRVIRRGGGGRSYLNHRLITAQYLEELLSPHIQLYSQMGEERFFSSRVETALLDRYGNLEDIVAEVEGVWERLKKLEATLKELSKPAEERERDLDYLRFSLEELERIQPQPGELSALEEKLRSHKERKRLGEIRELLLNHLSRGSPAVLELLYECESLLREGGKLEPAFSGFQEEFGEIIGRCEGLVQGLKKMKTPAEDPMEISRIEERISALKRLLRKYGDEEGLKKRWEEMKKRYEELLHLEERIKEVEKELMEVRSLYDEKAKKLSSARKETADRLIPRIEELLRSLALPYARFSIAGFGEGQAGPQGLDRIEFEFSPNPGEPLKPLRKIASGGERSRLLLSLYTAMGGEFPMVTLVFDELDTGVGGEAAHTIGQLLRRLSTEYQVISVTHTPQVAAYATSQLSVIKEVRGDQTHTRIQLLHEKERLLELSRMLGGSTSPEALAYAETLLHKAQEIPA